MIGNADGKLGANLGGSSCCGGSSSVGISTGSMYRQFNSRKGGFIGDFGMGQSSNYDFRLNLMLDSNNKMIADIETPNGNFARRLVDGRDGDTMDGVFNDKLNAAFKGMELLDANDQLTTSYASAVKAVLYTLDSRTFEFEIIDVAGDYCGRLTAVKDRNDYGIDIAYKIWTPTEIANSPS